MEQQIIRQYTVDAFTQQVFQGNPAAVCVLEQELSPRLMQNIARENNLSETAFALKKGDEYALRWFTPGGEVDLCGHATLATAYTLLRFVETTQNCVAFQTKSGPLTVTRRGDIYEMDLPAYPLSPVPVTGEMEQAIGARPVEAWLGRDLVCVMEREEQVRQALPREDGILKLEGLLVHLTAKGSAVDCVTRSFAPKLKIWEDPVCGSGHCHVAPLWADKLGKNVLTAFQASERSGLLHCRVEKDRVILGGQAALYAVSQIFVPLGEAEGV